MRLGIDIGSTTVKAVVMDDGDQILYKRYERHMSGVFEKTAEILRDIQEKLGDGMFRVVITGSGGLALAECLGLPFEQEVVTCSLAVKKFIPETDCVIELGGEDAKITFFGQSIEQRMNGTCAGGTGAFIDQMAILLNTDGAGLNEAAKDYDTIYPIAARCGVFAKTDIQPLINEGASLPNLAASIFQAVVNQTISGLACGHKIEGHVAYLGGPLSYMSELRNRFTDTLGLRDDEVIFPENAKYFVAIGASVLAEDKPEVLLSKLIKDLSELDGSQTITSKRAEPLFASEEEYEEFKERHAKATVARAELKDQHGPLYLGIDAGSTTTKLSLINSEKKLVYDFYKNNDGNPLEVVRDALKEIYDLLPEDCYIARSSVTGYGEGLIMAGFRVDNGLIETMAHYKAAEEFLPGVDFILDIGGQDMKCMRIRNGAIHNIMLNEACSSGCGSFIETYARSVDLPVTEFAKVGLMAESPVDLGTRCTVFMNSMVKQAQKEGASIGDIASGLSYSVIKNALYKVIKLRNPEEAGEKIVVQGGTFLNESCLRAIEKILGRDVVRPDIAGLMGAFGAALNSLEEASEGERSEILSKDELESFTYSSKNGRCQGCSNNCLLTITNFGKKARYVTGNRCEKGAGLVNSHNDVPNLYQYKLKRLFSYEPLSEERAIRGHIAIPRVLNMYEDYPFWFTFFTKLRYRVILSPMSSKKIYEKGMEYISSDTACYPAKIVHGHVKTLVEMGEKKIFYPCVNYEYIEDKNAPNHYNCPVVATYPEVIANNMGKDLEKEGVTFLHPFVPYDNDERLVKRMAELMADSKAGVSLLELQEAVKAAREEQLKFKRDVRREGLKALKYARSKGLKSIVLAGRPYHLDSEINHGIDKLITSFDMVVLSEDSICDEEPLERPIRVLDQWTYHSRLYRAANVVSGMNDVELIQLNSFGCGVDAVTTDEVMEILENSNKLYTLIKIDEGNNLGAIRIRIRSLKAAMEEREKNGVKADPTRKPFIRKYFTKQMKKDYTILVPQMSPIHFNYLEECMKACGYNVVLLPEDSNGEGIQEGLRYINNDACYPTLITLGQMIKELKTGNYDPDKVALIMSQTGGGCRASNYVSLLRKALKDLGLEQIPVISFNTGILEKNPGFKIDLKLGVRLLIGGLYGDIMQRCLYATRPYEVEPGAAEAVMRKYEAEILENCRNGSIKQLWKTAPRIIKDFDEVPRTGEVKPKVGVVGEILVKYHPDANNRIVDLIEKEGGEAVVLEFVDFFLYGMYNKKFNYEHLSGSRKQYLINMAGIKLVEYVRGPIRKALRESKHFTEMSHIEDTARAASTIASTGNQCGEGWLLTGEMIELIESGATNIACLQPFACLPNHVTGKGMMKAIREKFPGANIVAIDYDPGASSVNQVNRIKLMMANARYGLNEKKAI